MSLLLAALASASSSDELQAALLAFLPRHMLEDAEEQQGPRQQQQERQDEDEDEDSGEGDKGGEEQVPLPTAAAAAAAAPTAAAASLPRAIEAMLRRPADEQPLDSFALRHLALTRPLSLEPLSAFSASAARYVQRVAVAGRSGERAVLTFTLARRGAGRRARRHAATAPADGAAAAAAAHWFLVRIEGEQGGRFAQQGEAAAAAIGPVAAADADADARGTASASGGGGPDGRVLLRPSRELAPETVVAMQLAALGRGDVDGAFALVSSVGRAVAGDRARFGSLLEQDARFRPLLRHGGAASLRRTQSVARSYVEVVAVRPGGGGGGGGGEKEGSGGKEARRRLGAEAVYAFIASLHPPLGAAAEHKQDEEETAAAAAAAETGQEEEEEADGGGGERWLIDYVSPIRDPALLRTLLAQHTSD